MAKPENLCNFDMGWGGLCKAETGGGFCPKHAAMKCCSCGEQATRECSVDGTQFVCGSPLCDRCEHGPGGGGLFNLGGGHRRKPSAEALAQDSLVAATAPCPISTWESEGGAVPETDALIESASLYKALDEIEANLCQQVAAELNAPAPHGHVHTPACFEYDAPDAGGISMICGFE